MPLQITRIKRTPRRALAYLLSQEQSWKIPDKLAADIADATQHPSPEMNGAVVLPSEEGQLSHRASNMPASLASQGFQSSQPSPSRGRTPNIVGASRCTGLQSPGSGLPSTSSGSMFSGMNRTLDGMDGTSVSDFSRSEAPFLPTEFALHWQSNPPKYRGDFDTYIWQPYRKPPPFSYVRFYIIKPEVPRNLNVLLLFNDTRSLCTFRSRPGSESLAKPGHLLLN